jgi:dTDP-4-amino-4,6-dideoxygalactose transaminase
MIILINVTKTYLPKKEEYTRYLDIIYKNNWLTNNGPLVQELERRLKEYLGVSHLLLVSNGTLALQIAYRALNLEGEVITTPFSFAATTSSMAWEGLTPVFADIDPNTLCINPSNIEGKIKNNTTAIVPVHVFGNACDVEKIEEIASKYKLKTIYDAAHAFSVNYKNKSILNYGDISILSFHSTKLFHTIEGGALIFKDEDIYKRAKLLINFGISGPDVIEGIGINCKMNEFQAAMGLCVLDDLEKIKLDRSKVYEKYISKLSEVKGITYQQINENCTMNYSYFPVIFESEEILLNVRKALNDKNIYPRRYFYPSLDTLNYLRSTEVMPISNRISKQILCLPMYDSLKEDEINLICDIISNSLNN